MQVVALYEGLSPDQVKAELRRLGTPDAAILNFSDDPAAGGLGEVGVVQSHTDVLGEAELTQLHLEAFQRGRQWYRTDGPSPLAYAGIDLPSLIELEATVVFLELLLTIRCLETFRQRGPFTLVAVRSGSVPADLCRAFTQAHGLELVSLDASKAVSSVTDLGQRSPIDGWAKYAATRSLVLASQLLGPRGATGRRCLTFDYYRFRHLIDRCETAPPTEPRPPLLLVLGSGARRPLRTLGRTGGCRYISPLGYLGIRSFLRLKYRESRQIARGLGLLRAFRRPDDEYHHLDLRPLINRWLVDAFASHYRNLVFLTAAFERVLDAERVDTVMANHDAYALPRLLVVLGRRRGVRTICLQHGHSAEIPNQPPYLAREVMVWGEKERDFYLRERRAEPDQIKIVGDPYAPELLKRVQRRDQKSVRRELGLPTDAPVVLFTMERYHPYTLPWQTPADPNRALTAMCHAVAALPGVHLVLRYSPNKAYERFGGRLDFKRFIVDVNAPQERVHINTRGDIAPWLFAADVVVVGHSTAGLEAMLFDRPVVLLNLTGRRDLVDYVRAGAALGVYRDSDLLPAIKVALGDQSVRARLAAAQRTEVAKTFRNASDPDPLSPLLRFLWSEPVADRQAACG